MIYEIITNERRLTVNSPTYSDAMDWVLANYPGEQVISVTGIPTVGVTDETDETGAEE